MLSEVGANEIATCVKLVRQLVAKGALTRDDRRRLARAKLQLALWACAQNRLPVTRFALTEILGPDTAFVFSHAAAELLAIRWESQEDREATAEIIAAHKPPQNTSPGTKLVYH
jgi:hypothetical protein